MCRLVKNDGKLIIGKKGINMIQPQFQQLEANTRAVCAAMAKNIMQLKIDLGYNETGFVSKERLFQSKFEKRNASILVDKEMVENFHAFLHSITDEIDLVIKKIFG